MAIIIKKPPAKAALSTTVTEAPGKKVVSQDHSVESVQLPDDLSSAASLTPYCEVGYTAGYTHNLGNYQSARFDVSLKIPCLQSEIDAAFKYAEDWVSNRMEALTAEFGEKA